MTDTVHPVDTRIAASKTIGDASGDDARATARDVASQESVAPENRNLLKPISTVAKTRELVKTNRLPSMHVEDGAGGCACCHLPPAPDESTPALKKAEPNDKNRQLENKGGKVVDQAAAQLAPRAFEYNADGSATYQVRSGDTLTRISRAALRAAKGDVAFKPTEQAIASVARRIADANNIEQTDMHLIRPEMPPLKIPKDVVGVEKLPTDRVPVPGSEIIESAGASKEFVGKVKQAVEKLPPEVRRLLEESGVKIIAAGEIADYDPNLARSRPRGWPPGSSWANADGLQASDKRIVLVAENTRDGSGTLKPSRRTQGVINHEVGHSVDVVLGHFSHSDAFKAAYDKDILALSAADQIKYGYFLQGKGDNLNYAGREEAHADVFAAMKGASSNSAETEATLKNFPNSRQAIDTRLAELRQEQNRTDMLRALKPAQPGLVSADVGLGIMGAGLARAAVLASAGQEKSK